MSRVCPHCQGTGYSDARVKPVFDYAGVRLPKRQAQLLGLLLDAEGRELQRDFLANQIYGDRQPTSRVIDAAICRLRKNLEGTDVQIHSYQTGGYQLVRAMPGRFTARQLWHSARFAG